MLYDYDVELEGWRIRMAAKPVTRYVYLGAWTVKRPARRAAAWVEYDGDQMPRYEDESQEAA